MTASPETRYHAEVVTRERTALSAIANPPLPGSSLQESQRSTLQLIDPTLASISTKPDPLYHDRLTGIPTPGLFLIARALIKATHEKDPDRRQRIADFLHDTLFPLARIDPGETTVSGTLTHLKSRQAGCFRAESYFATAAAQYTTPYGWGEHRLLRAYHTREGKLLAFGKEIAAPSALLVEPVAAGPVTLPAGTIVHFSIDDIDQILPWQYEHWGMAACQLSEKPAIEPVRMSAWAYTNSQDRGLFAVTEGSTRRRQDVYDTVVADTLDTFRRVGVGILTDFHVGM